VKNAKTDGVVRFTVSVPQTLAKQLDRMTREKGYDNCLEVLAVRGRAGTIKKIADELIAAKGVKHGRLTVTSSGKDLPS